MPASIIFASQLFVNLYWVGFCFFFFHAARLHGLFDRQVWRPRNLLGLKGPAPKALLILLTALVWPIGLSLAAYAPRMRRYIFRQYIESKTAVRSYSLDSYQQEIDKHRKDPLWQFPVNLDHHLKTLDEYYRDFLGAVSRGAIARGYSLSNFEVRHFNDRLEVHTKKPLREGDQPSQKESIVALAAYAIGNYGFRSMLPPWAPPNAGIDGSIKEQD